MQWEAKWIKPSKDYLEVAPLFIKDFCLTKKVKKAELHLSALGVYEANINGQSVSTAVLMPGWTAYHKRLQYQTYDVTELLLQENPQNNTNQLCISVGKGWYRSRLVGWTSSSIQKQYQESPAALIAQLVITYEDNSIERIDSDESWKCCESPVRFSEIYDGEIYDARIRIETQPEDEVEYYNGPTQTLIEHQGEPICETETLYGASLFTTPKGEVVLDFGQEITGYVELSLNAHSGDLVELSHAEVLDKNGNFYTDNYRSAKAKLSYTCCEGKQTYKPKHTFFGFRYIRLDVFPGGVQNAKKENFKAIVVHSAMKRTGFLQSSDSSLNQLFDNIAWGQKGNFLDVPTDCPQRDERLGWTGDAQVFVRTAALQYDVERFFTKWLSDLAAEQREDGMVGHFVPTLLPDEASAAWGDAATICPWEIYLAYGNKGILENQYDSMKKWVDYITHHSSTPNLWTGGKHFGDWLGLDAPSGSYKGSSREDFIASAFYAHSTSLLIKSGKVLGKEIVTYEALYQQIVETFQKTFPTYTTQTECVLAAHFQLSPNPQATADQLAEMIRNNNMALTTGFVGTPYLLHVLGDYGYADIAYSLLLRKQYPGWLFSVTMGATTVWEHWDGIMENGDFWSPDMNSYNHYAYGAVADWVYGFACGIKTIESHPGYEKVLIAPHPDGRLDWLKASLETRHGLLRSEWKKTAQGWRYEIETPVDATIIIGQERYEVPAGIYTLYSEICVMTGAKLL